MSLRELTKEKHTSAEHTKFMKTLFKGNITKDMWADFTYQKMLCYNAMELKAALAGYLDKLPELPRTHQLYLDYRALTDGQGKHTFRPEAAEYYKYLVALDNNKILAHMYVWYLGDLSGGQLIKKIVPGPNNSLTFKNAEELTIKFRSLLNDDLAEEANVAFDWAIKLMESYDNELSV